MAIEATAPVVIDKQFNFQTGQSIPLRFDKSVRAHLDAGDFTLVRVNSGPVWTVASSDLIISYDRVTDAVTITFGGSFGRTLPDGDYQLTITASGVSDLAGNALGSDVTLDFFVLKGDVNHDRQVGIADFITLASNFGKSEALYRDGDLNYDGQVTIADFIDLSANFNKTLSAPGAQSPQAAASTSILASPEKLLSAGIIIHTITGRGLFFIESLAACGTASILGCVAWK